MKSHFADELSDAAIATLLEHDASRPNPSSLIAIRTLGGAISQVERDDSGVRSSRSDVQRERRRVLGRRRTRRCSHRMGPVDLGRVRTILDRRCLRQLLGYSTTKRTECVRWCTATTPSGSRRSAPSTTPTASSKRPRRHRDLTAGLAADPSPADQLVCHRGRCCRSVGRMRRASMSSWVDARQRLVGEVGHPHDPAIGDIFEATATTSDRLDRRVAVVRDAPD